MPNSGQTGDWLTRFVANQFVFYVEYFANTGPKFHQGIQFVWA
jgi:hypothetical protein